MPWGPQPPYQPVPQYAPPAPPQYQQPQYVPVGSGQPSFLRGAMQTAAGVAAGALAFEGVESILHGFGGGGGYGMGGFGGGRPEETVINNYYDQPGTQGFEHDRPEGEHHHDAAQFSDTGSDSSSGDDQGGYDNSSDLADNSGDNSSGFDDGGGGFDDGGSGFDDGGGGDLS